MSLVLNNNKKHREETDLDVLVETGGIMGGLEEQVQRTSCESKRLAATWYGRVRASLAPLCCPILVKITKLHISGNLFCPWYCNNIYNEKLIKVYLLLKL